MGLFKKNYVEQNYPSMKSQYSLDNIRMMATRANGKPLVFNGLSTSGPTKVMVYNARPLMSDKEFLPLSRKHDLALFSENDAALYRNVLESQFRNIAYMDTYIRDYGIENPDAPLYIMWAGGNDVANKYINTVINSITNNVNNIQVEVNTALKALNTVDETLQEKIIVTFNDLVAFAQQKVDELREYKKHLK